ncbi:MAG TPA: hypothetical protein VF250_14915 [Conexibacter sp.]
MHAYWRPPAPARAVLAFGLLAFVAGLFAVLSQRAQRLAGTNDVSATTVLTQRVDSLRICQADELLPADADVVRIAMQPATPDGGPPLRITWHDPDGRVLAHGSLSAGWRAPAPPVPLRRAIAIASDVRGRLCLVFGRAGEAVLLGDTSAAAQGGMASPRGLDGRIRVEYLRAGRETWWSVAPAVTARMGRGRAFDGAWAALLVVLLAIGVVGVVIALLRTAR